MDIKQRIASMSDRQKLWAAVLLAPVVPVLAVASIPILVVLMILTILYSAAEEIIDSLWRWASGIPQRKHTRPPPHIKGRS